MALYEVEAPDGELLKIEGPEGASEQEVIAQAQKLYTPAKKDTGFTGAARSSYEKMKGEGALVLGKLGLMDADEAEKYYNSKKKKSEAIFQPTEKGWDEAPFEKFRELLGSSAPYMVAPLAAAGAVAAAPEAIAGLGIGAIGAPAIAGFTANVGQFTGTNLGRQVDEGKRLNDANLGAAVAAAIPQSILDIATDHMVPGVKNIFGKAGIKLADDEAAAIAKQQLVNNIPKGKIATALEYGGKAAQTAAIEGLNESGQQVFERLQAGLELNNEEARKEYFDNFIGGAVLGGAIAVPGHYYDKNVEQPRKEKLLEAQRQADAFKKQQQEQAAQQAQLQQTYENLNVPQATNLLPAPEKAAPIPEKNLAPAIQQDMLQNYNGHFNQQAIDNVFGKGAFDQINDMREMDHGKPRLREMSIEDLAHAGASPEDLSRLLTVQHDYTNVKEKNFAPAQIIKMADKKGIETGTKGFNDFLMRTTGTDNLQDMTYAQRHAVAKAIGSVPTNEGAKTILPEGQTNATPWHHADYDDAVQAVQADLAQHKELSQADVMKTIQGATFLGKGANPRAEDAKLLLDEMIRRGDVSLNVRPDKSSTPDNPRYLQTIIPPHPIANTPAGMDVRREILGEGRGRREVFSLYEDGQRMGSFPTKQEAEEHGMSRLHDDVLKQVITAAPQQLLPSGDIHPLAKRYAEMAKNELNERQGISRDFRGITTKQGLEGANERLAKLGIFNEKVEEILPELKKDLEKKLKQYGLGQVAVRMVDSIANGAANAQYHAALIKIAMYAKDPMGELDHETIHALIDLGAFRPDELRVLENKAKSEWLKKYIKDTGLYEKYKEQYELEGRDMKDFEADMLEESVAEAFKHFNKGKPPAGMIGSLFKRLNKFFEAVRNSFNGLGFKTADDIFAGVTRGEFKPTRETAGEDKFAMRKEDVNRRTMADLERAIPPQQRVVSKNPTKMIDGKPFSQGNLNETGYGFLPFEEFGAEEANRKINDIWQQSINESGGKYVQDIVNKLNAKPPTAQFLNNALSLPNSARYWYELSGEKINDLPLPAQMKDMFINFVSGTSGNAKPLENMRRAISAFSEYQQNKPINTDLISKKTVENAIRNPDLETLKFGNFAGTMKYVSGMTNKAPITTNDRQVAAIFNMKPEDFVKNQSLYEVISRFYNKLRDEQNSMIPAQMQPYESWQLQALSWVEQRAEETSYKEKTGDDYAQAIDAITAVIRDAGLPLTNDKIGLNTLRDPRLPTLLSKTIVPFQDALKATVESNTLLNTQGLEANAEYEKIKNVDEPWAKKLSTKFERIQRKAFEDLRAKGIIENLVSTIVGKKANMSRIDTDSFGTFEGALSPNMRIPLYFKDSANNSVQLTDEQAEVFLAILNDRLDQAAGAASLFKPTDGPADTYRLFFPNKDLTSTELDTLSKELGYPLNIYKEPNGSVVEINIGGFDTKPDAESVKAATAKTFGNIKMFAVPATYKSLYITKNKEGAWAKSYKEVVNGFRNSQFRGSEKDGLRKRFDAGIKQSSQAIRTIAKERDKEFASFTEQTRAERAKRNAKLGVEKYSLKAPNTEEFKRWFGDSKVVNEDGSPKVVYHASKVKNVNEFNKRYKTDLSSMGFHFGTEAQASFRTSQYDFDSNTPTMGQYYLSIKNPLEVSHMASFAPDHLADHMMDLGLLTEEKYEQLQNKHDYQTLPLGEELVKILKKSGYDGLIYENEREGEGKSYVPFEPNQIKSATDNTGAFNPEEADIRYSLTNAPPQNLTVLEKQESAGERLNTTIKNVTDAAKDQEFWTGLRNNWVDKGSGLAKTLQNQEIYKDGVLRADLLNRAYAQVINLVKNGLQSGIPIINNDGSIIIKTDPVNNLANSQIIADKLDENQFVKDSGLSGRGYVAEVARALRGKEIMEEDKALGLNRELQVKPEQIAWAEKQIKNVPELNQIFGIWKNVNTALVNLWEQSGLIGKAEADSYRAKKHYVSLAASKADLEEMINNQYTGNAPGLKSTEKTFKLEGAELDRNIWENVDKQYAAMLTAAYQNHVRRTAVDQLRSIGMATTDRNEINKIKKETGKDPVNLRYKENGKIVDAIVHNQTDLAAFEAMHYELNPIMKFMAGSTRLLRAGALLNPMFWVRQLIKDPIHANLVANSGIVTPFHSASEFMRILMKDSEEAKLLAQRGVIGQYDSTVDIYDFLNQVGKEKTKPSTLDKALHELMQIHEASDAATRVAIFKKEKANALARNMSEADATNYAVMKARESINFAVHGNSKTLFYARHMVPFLSASIASLDTVYRAATGFGLPPAERAAARKLFKQRAFMLAAMTTAYAMLMQNDDDYKKLPDYVKDNNWLIKNPVGDGFIKIPTPFEVGFLFKTIPEAGIRYMYGTSTGKEVLHSYWEGVTNNLPGGALPIPQLFKPALETVTNHSFYTGNTIESLGDARLPVEDRGRNASEIAKKLSKSGLSVLNLSPAKIDNLIQGYTAELGTLTTGVADKLIYAAEGKTPPATNLAKDPFFKSFLTDPNADKAVSDFYDIEANANQVAQEFSQLKAQGKAEEIKDFISDAEKMKKLQGAPALRRIGQNMTALRKQIAFIQDNQAMSPEDRRDKINQLTAQYNRVAEQGVKIASSLGLR
jgi:Large polyvalent protein associated domain 38/ADP-Ribosyltransferase in polyvalent proteins